jgi:hypothetical protein
MPGFVALVLTLLGALFLLGCGIALAIFAYDAFQMGALFGSSVQVMGVVAVVVALFLILCGAILMAIVMRDINKPV